jgi:hypothetical protein
MNQRSPAPKFLLAGFGLALLVTYALGQAAPPAKAHFEYRIVQDVSAAELTQLANEGWEYAGYLGEGVKGQGNDETLWRRPQ